MVAEVLPSEELRGRLDAYLSEERKPVFTLGDVRRVTGRSNTTSFSMRQWERIAEIAREWGGDLREGKIVLTAEGFREAALYMGLPDLGRLALGKSLTEKRWGGEARQIELSLQVASKLELLRNILKYGQEYPKPLYGPQDLCLATGRSETTHFGNISSLARLRVVEVARKYGVQVQPYVHWRLSPAAFIDAALALGPPDTKLQEYRKERARAMHTNETVLAPIAAIKRERPRRRVRSEEKVGIDTQNEPQELTDIFDTYDREINHIPVLKAAEERLFSACLFSARLALRGLRQIGQIADLPRSVGLRLPEIIEAGTGKYLLEEDDEELRRRSAESKDEPKEKADIAFVRVVSRYDAWIIRKLSEFVDVQDELAREQVIRTFAERQFQLFEEGKQAFNMLVEHNLRLVRKIALRFRGRGVPDDDLEEEGNLGLMKAAVRFDWRRGYKFSTYATRWVKQHISRAVDNSGDDIRIPVHVHTALRKLSRAKERMTQELGREVSMAEAAEGFGVTDRIWRSGMEATNILSLEQSLTEEGDRTMEDVIGDGDGDGVEKEAGFNLLRDEISGVLAGLPARTRRIIEMRFGLNGGKAMTLEEVGINFDVSKERIRQIEARGLKLLRHPARSKRLRPYLGN